MSAFPAAKRSVLLFLPIFLLFFAAGALADEDQGYLGVHLQDLSPSMAKALQLDEESGVLVSEVVTESPAAKAGLEDGDVILEVAGKTTEDSGDLTKIVRKSSPGDEVKVVVLREGKKKDFTVKLGEREDDVWTYTFDGDDEDAVQKLKWIGKKGAPQIKMLHGDDLKDVYITKDMAFFDEDRGFLGIHLDDVEGQMAEYFEVGKDGGVLVTEVVADSPAAAAGLKAGDVIVKLNGEKTGSGSELHGVMADTEPDQEVKVEILRKGKAKDFTVTLGEMPEDALMKKLQIIGEDGDFRIKAPKGEWHMAPEGLEGIPHAEHRIIRRLNEDGEHEIHVEVREGEMDELRQEMKSLKKELKELKEELKK